MSPRLQWLPDAEGTPWKPLGDARRSGLPVPTGFIAPRTSPEGEVRNAYEELKIREKTHFVAVRGASHTVLNVIGSDAVLHALRRLWTEDPNSQALVQRMIHATWCGKAQWHRQNLRIKANEGMMVLDPDTYLVNSSTGKCIRHALEPKQRKMIRHVDGSSRVVEREGERAPMPPEHLVKIAELATRVGSGFSWAIDDLDNVWLLSVA